MEDPNNKSQQLTPLENTYQLFRKSERDLAQIGTKTAAHIPREGKGSTEEISSTVPPWTGQLKKLFNRPSRVPHKEHKHLDEFVDPSIQASGLVALPGHSRNVYDNYFGTSAAESISHNRTPDVGAHSEQEMAHATSQLHGAHHFTIDGNPRFENIGVKNEYIYGNHGAYEIAILKEFKEFVSFNAFYNSSAQDPTRRVHPGTRQDVLKRIRGWIDDPSMTERIFWLHGPAGVGKSAIAQTIARSCDQDKLAATFFFFRSDTSRNDGNRLFPTLAWQLAFSIPAAKHALIYSLNGRLDIPMRDVETQFEELIVKPFQALKASGAQPSGPVVIIDGVDECSDDGLQRRFLKIIGNAVKDKRVPLRFLICSRPEAHIQDIIDSFQSYILPLDLAKLDDANQDIEKYLKAEFSRIASEQDLDPSWPGEDIIQEFVYKASGQFVYASTVIKYVGDEYSSAQTQLDIIRGLKPRSTVSPFSELDELYMEILRRQRDPDFLKDFLSLLIGRDGSSIANLHKDDALLMNVSKKELQRKLRGMRSSLKREPYIDAHHRLSIAANLHKDDALLMNVSMKELQRKLRGMRSVLKLEPYIDVHHRSFLEFLQDASRSGQNHISKQVGTQRYLGFIVNSLVRYVSSIIEHHDEHIHHFQPQFYLLTYEYPGRIASSIEEWQDALQPLLDIPNKLLASSNFTSTWELLSCDQCTGFHAIRNLLLQLTFRLRVSDPITYTLMGESHTDRSERMHSNVAHSTLTSIEMNTPETNLGSCLSSLLACHRARKIGTLLDVETIQFTCSLIRFDHDEISTRLRSISDAQALVDLIDEVINTKYNYSHIGPAISCKAVRLALEIYVRLPVLPRSLFLKGTVSPHHYVWSGPTTEAELLFHSMFMSKFLNPSYTMRVLWVYEENNKIYFVGNKVTEGQESLSQWRKRTNPSSQTRIRVMLEVAKAIQYFHSMSVMLHNYVDSDWIFLDSDLHAKFRFFGLTAHHVKTVERTNNLGRNWQSYEADIYFFGCLFYEMCFDIKITRLERIFNTSATNSKLAKRPSNPEIHDDVWQLIQRCCAQNPNIRPTMDDILREIESWVIT